MCLDLILLTTEPGLCLPLASDYLTSTFGFLVSFSCCQPDSWQQFCIISCFFCNNCCCIAIGNCTTLCAFSQLLTITSGIKNLNNGWMVVWLGILGFFGLFWVFKFLGFLLFFWFGVFCWFCVFCLVFLLSFFGGFLFSFLFGWEKFSEMIHVSLVWLLLVFYQYWLIKKYVLKCDQEAEMIPWVFEVCSHDIVVSVAKIWCQMTEY